MMTIEERRITNEERERLMPVCECALPPDLDIPLNLRLQPDLPQGIAVAGYALAWFFCTAFIGMVVTIAVTAVLVHGVDASDNVSAAIAISVFAIAILVAIAVTWRFLHRHFHTKRRIPEYRENLMRCLDEPLEVLTAKPEAAFLLVKEGANPEVDPESATEYVLDLGGGHLLYVDDPRRFGLLRIRPDFEGKFHEVMPYDFPNLEIRVFRTPGSGNCVGVTCHDIPMIPKTLALSPQLARALPHEVDLLSPETIALVQSAQSLVSPTTASPFEQRQAAAKRRSLAGRGVLAGFLFLVVLQLFGAGFKFAGLFSRRYTATEINTSIANDESFHRPVCVEGTVETQFTPVNQRYEDRGNQTLVISDATGKVHFLFDPRLARPPLQPGDKVKVWAKVESVQINLRVGYQKRLRATEVEVLPQ